MPENIVLASDNDSSNPRTADYLIQIGALVIVGGYALLVAALMFQRSATATVIGLYSTRYAVLLSILLMIGLLGVLGLATYWSRLPRLVQRFLSSLPNGVFSVAVVLGANILGWVWRFPIYSILAEPVFFAGLVLMCGGVLLWGVTIWLVNTRSLLIAIAALTTTYGLLLVWAILFERPFGGAGLPLLAIPAVVFAVYTIVEFAVRWWQAGQIQLSNNYISIFSVVALVGLTLYVVYIYRGAFLHNMGDDELIYIHFMKQTSFTQLFTESPVPFIYRPLYGLEIKLYYFLFGIDHAKYLAVAIAIYVISIALLVRVLRLVGAGLGIAFAVVFALPAHTFASDFLSIWPAEIVMLIGVITALVLMLCLRPQHSWKWYLALFGLLFIALLCKEYSFAIVGSVMFYALIGFFARLLDRRQTIWIFVVCLVATGLYFALRLHALSTVLGSTVDEETCGPFICYTSEQLALFNNYQHWLLYAYTVIGPNFLGNFFPFFANDGNIVASIWQLWLVLLICIGMGFLIAQAASYLNGQLENKRKWLGLLLGVVVCGFGLALPAWGQWVNQYLATPQQLALALHGVLMVGLGVAYAKIGSLEKSEVLAIALAIGLMLASSVAAYPYARYRTHYLALFGWAILFVIIFRSASRRPALWYLRPAMLVGLLALVFVNSVRIDQALPSPMLLPENFRQTASYICDPVVVNDQMALDISDHYGIAWEEIRQCRETGRNEP